MYYPCLVMDHDDTVVNSTATVHYPCFVEYCAKYLPGVHYTLREYFEKNFDPGVSAFFRGELGMDEAQLRREQDYWYDYASRRTSAAYAGMHALLWEQRRRGGSICVVSHSFTENIRRDYAANDLPVPDLIYGWDCPPECRKPSPWPLQQISRRLGVRPEEMLVVDDLKPGLDMARAFGCDFAAALWSSDIPVIGEYMHAHTPFCFASPAELSGFLFGIH